MNEITYYLLLLPICTVSILFSKNGEAKSLNKIKTIYKNKND